MENLKNIQPLDEFNWEAYESGEALSPVSKEDQEKAYDNTLNKVNEREVVEGTVISMNKREVVVNIGYKSDGIIPMSEKTTHDSETIRKLSALLILWFSLFLSPNHLQVRPTM